MTERALVEQLDQAIGRILAGQSAAPLGDARLAPLALVAVELRVLSRPDFKARLKADLERKAAMTTPRAKVGVRKPKLQEFQTVTPYLTARDADGLIAFVQQAFGAELLLRTGPGTAGGLHSEVRVGDCKLMIGGGGEGFKWRGESQPTGLHLYVADADAVYRRALAAGASSLEEPVDQPYGDRESGVKDAAGNVWWIATHKATGLAPEGLRAVTPFLHPTGAPEMIDFLKRAFAAEEVERHASPEGVVQHAMVRIGNSMIEMGEAHGAFQNMPTTFLLYLDDVDAWYERALKAVATSLESPTDQRIGGRRAAVKDPWGNQWYMMRPMRPAPSSARRGRRR